MEIQFTEQLTEAQAATVAKWEAEDVASGKRPAPSQPPTPSTSAPTSPVAPGVSPGPVTALSLAQQLKAGTLTTTQVSRLAKSGHIDLLDVARSHAILTEPAPSKAEDTRSPEVKVLDQHFPAAHETDYTIRYGDPGEALTRSAELQSFDHSARTWLAAAEFPKAIGDSLVNEIDRTTQHTQRMTESELEAYGFSEFEKLQKVYGDTLEDKLRQAGKMVHELDQKSPGLKNLLRAKGIGDNAMVASLIIQQAERWHARRNR